MITASVISDHLLFNVGVDGKTTAVYPLDRLFLALMPQQVSAMHAHGVVQILCASRLYYVLAGPGFQLC